ncbi:MAG: GGDEF domain-containing protein [Lachnospiraceae bacterium]|nr:GGDEF domain-containing protein [Lachnospiraceae bacterium]
MSEKRIEDYTLNDVVGLLEESVDTIVIADSKENKYKTLVRRGFFADNLEETGNYHDLIEKLWFHLANSNEKVVGDYKSFVSYYGDFKGKYSRRLKLYKEGSNEPSVIQLNVYPIVNAPDKYIFTMDELADEYKQEYMTTGKVNAIQSSYLFSMYVDLVQDTTGSINVSEISDDTVNAALKYSEWRLMIVNMIGPDDKEMFLKVTDPEYLKANLAPGRMTSFDCQMANLEGKFIWVKLIFNRVKTRNEDDFRFVFLVQDINDNSEELFATLKKYEDLAQKDSLTELMNHGSIKTEIINSMDLMRKEGVPVSLLMFDLDRFKKVNDTYGHATGDKVLKHFSGLLKKFIKGKDAEVGRWGGEEFVIVYRGKNFDKVKENTEALRKEVEFSDFPEIGHITCSIGVTEIKKEDTFEKAFERVDRALYASKESGRNRMTVL